MNRFNAIDSIRPPGGGRLFRVPLAVLALPGIDEAPLLAWVTYVSLAYSPTAGGRTTKYVNLSNNTLLEQRYPYLLLIVQDTDVVTIFKGLVPSLERAGTDTPLLTNEFILLRLTEWPQYQSRPVRKIDLAMIAVHGAKERIKAELEVLLKKADPRYDIRTVFDDVPLEALGFSLARASNQL
ncbi:O-methyltransferase [Apiospora marii]|uniref:O-methyltransferase n=1 Tax=Apiospora marii TaxID=335849 RepID=A0ABR1RNJ6_9PEZI